MENDHWAKKGVEQVTSPKAKELVRRLGLSGTNMQEVLEEKPELMNGLDEYLAWRDKTNSAIDGHCQAPSVGHEMAKIRFPALP